MRHIIILLLFSLFCGKVWAEGSKDLLTNDGYRAYLLSSTQVSTNNPFPTLGTVKVYVKVGETLLLGSSAQGYGKGKIIAKTPNGIVYNSGTSTVIGRIASLSEEQAGPLPNLNGYNPYQLTVKNGEEGVWEINFVSPDSTKSPTTNMPPVKKVNDLWAQRSDNCYVSAFDVTVKDDGGLVKSGRSYMDIYSGCLGDYNYGFNGVFQVLTKDGYIYEVNNNEQRGFVFAFFVNNKGFLDNSGKSLYKSIPNTSGKVHDPRSKDTSTDITHKIFFSEPSSDLPASAPMAGGGTTWLLAQPKSPSASNFLFTGYEGTLYKGGTFPLGGEISFDSDQAVSYSVSLDLDQNGIFTDDIDTIITGDAKIGRNYIRWDGLNGKGVPSAGTFSFQPKDIKVTLRGGEVHFPFTDVEKSPKGIIITRKNGLNSNNDIIYWDDINIKKQTSYTKTQLNGASSTTDGHKWDTSVSDIDGFGNNVGLDTWTYIESSPIGPLMNIELRKADLEVISITTAKNTYCIGEEITYSVRVKNNGPDAVSGSKFILNYPLSFQFTGIDVVSISGVSNTYNNAATSTQFSTFVDLSNGAELTLLIRGKSNASGLFGSVMAGILRPADVTDPGATNADSAPPIDLNIECGSGGCNNIRNSGSLNITTVGISISNAAVTEKTNIYSEIAFPITLSSVTQCPVTVSYVLAHGSTNDSDFDSSISKTGTVTIPAGQTSALLKLLLNGDRTIEANESFTITLSNPIGGSFNSKIATGTIVNDDTAELSVTSTAGAETGTVAGKFNFSLTNVSDADTEIDYVLTGDATAGADFTGSATGTIIIPAGASTATLTLPVLDDDIVEGDEVSKIALTRLFTIRTGTISNTTTISPEVKISDNDDATLNLSSDVVLNEGPDNTVNATFTLTLNKQTSRKFTLNYRTDDLTATVADNDYFPTGTVSLEFNGLKNESKTITIPVVGDKKIEGDEAIKLSIFNLSDSFGNRLTIPKDAGNVTITNDDNGQISILSSDAEEGVKSGTFTFKLPAGITADVPLTITYALSGDATGGGTDYAEAVTGTIIIPAGQNSVTLVLPVIDDAVAEGAESVLISASVATNSYSVGLANSTQSLSITDNDKALITISPATVTEGNSGTKTASFEVKLNVATASGFSVNYKTIDGTAISALGDYVAIPSGALPLNFNGTSGETYTINVTVNADRKIEADETFSVQLDNPSVNFGNNLSLFNTSATGTILDDDSGVITVTSSNGSENGPQNGSFVFSFPSGVSSDKPSRINFELDGDAQSGVDYTASASTYVEIPAGQSSVTLTLSVSDDMIVEGEEKVKLKNVALISDYSRISLNSSIPEVSIEDNDAATLTLTGPVSIFETSGQTTATFSVKLDKPVSKQFSISFNTENGLATTADNDYVATSGILTFNGTAGQTLQIPVIINGDAKVESDENFLVKLSALSNNFSGKLSVATTQTSCLIKNDDNAQLVLSAAQGAEGMYDAAVTFSLSNGASADKPTTIDYTLSGSAISGSDYTLPVAGTAIIPAGKTSVTVDIPVIDDDLLENTEDVKISATVRTGAYNFSVQNSPVSLDILDNDQATITIASPVSITEGNSGTVNLEFEVKLSKQSSKSLTLKYNTTNGTATAGSDYVAQTGTINISPTVSGMTQKISIPVTGDFLIEGDETFKVTLSDLSENFAGRLNFVDPNATGRILNDDGGDITITHKDGAEAGQTPEFIFSLPLGYSSAQPTVLTYTLDGTASSGADYNGASTSITIPAGVNSVSLPLPVINDDIVESDESVEISVSNVSNGLVMANNFDKLNIADNDKATLSINSPLILTESNSGTPTATFTVTLDKQTSKGFSVSYATADGTAKVSDNDYLPANATISFSGTSAGETKTFTVPVNGDTKIEKDETFAVELSNISDTFKDKLNVERLSFGVKTSGGTIKNDDAASITITCDGGKEGVKPASFLFSLVGGTADEDLKISYNLTGDAIGAGKDYVGATTGEVTIPAGQSSIKLDLAVVDDAILEDAENIVLNATGVSTSYPINLSNSTETVSITDNDQAILTLTGVTVTEGDDGVKTASFSLRLDNETSKNFDINYATADGTATVADADYVAKTGKAQFAGNAAEVQTIDVIINGDRKVEADEAYSLLLSGLSYNFDNRLTISSLTATGSILNNDQTQVSITSVNGKEAGSVPAIFEFSYPAGFTSDKDVTIQYTLSGGAISTKDFTPAGNSSITILAGQPKATLTLPVIDDQVVEGNEDIKLSVSAVLSSNPVTIADQSKTLTIEDNDEATLTLSSDVTITEGNTGQTAATFSVTLDKEISSGFTLGYATSDILAKTADNDYIASAGTLTFSGTANETKTVSIAINGDRKIEANQTFRFSLGALVSQFNNLIKLPAVSSRTVTVNNDDISSLIISKVDGKEGAKDASFTIGFEDGIISDELLLVDYFLSGDAISSSDYTGVNGLATIPAGQNSVTILLPVIDDASVEQLETIKITASARSNSHSIAVSNSPQSPVIEDNDNAQLSISPVAILEGDNGTTEAVFEIKLKGTTANGFDVRYKTVDGTATSADGDFAATPSAGDIVHFTGTLNESKTFKIIINADRTIESDETFSVALDLPAGTQNNTITFDNATATATIINDDSGVIAISATPFREDNPAGAAVKFSFPTGVRSDKPTRINFKLEGDAVATTDFSFNGQEWVEIPAGQESITLPLPVVDDVIVEEEEKLNLKNIALANPSTLITLVANNFEVPVIDNDEATLTLSGPVSTLESAKGQTALAAFSLKLDKEVSKVFSIAYNTQDGAAQTSDNDYISTSGTLTFNGPAETQTITVVINGDKKVEKDEDFWLKLASLSNTFNSRLKVVVPELSSLIKNDDNAQVVITKVDGAEGSNNASLTFSLSNGSVSDSPTTIDYVLSGSANTVEDYTLATTGTVTIKAGDEKAVLDIPVVDDDKVESTETIQASATVNSVYGFTVQNSPVSVNINDNDFATITLVGPVFVNEGNSGTTNLVFDVKLNKELSSPVSLKYKTSDGTALAGSDYSSQTGTLSFKTAGQVEKITIPVTGDLSIEPDETLKLNLFDLSDNISGKLSLVDPEAIGHISNDDGGNIEITSKNGEEGGNIAEFTFSFPAGISSPQATTIDYQLAGKAVGADYTGSAVSGSVVIPAGANFVSLQLPVVDDAIVELDEDIELTVTNVYNGQVMKNTFKTATITDNDIAFVSLSAPVTVVETDGTTTTTTFTATLDKQISRDMVVSYLSSDGLAKVSDNDYLPASGTLAFAKDLPANQTKTFTVTINGDNKIERDETFGVELNNISETFKDKDGADRLSFGARTSTVTIQNDDNTAIEIKGDDAAEGVKGGRFVFNLTGGVTSDEDVIISYNLSGDATGAGTDYPAGTTGSVTIVAGAASVPLEIPVIDDAILEDLETILLTGSTITSQYPINYLNSTQSITITDNDKAALSISNISLTEGDDGIKLATFNVKLDNPTSKSFSVDFTTANGTATVADADYVNKTDKLQFIGKAGESLPVEIAVNGDRKIEGDEIFNLLLSNLSYNYNNRLTLNTASAKATIVNNDQSEIFISKIDGKEEGTVAAAFEFSYKAGYSSDKDARIDYSLSGVALNGTDYSTTAPASITIPAGQQKAAVSLAVVDDQIVEDREDVKLSAGPVQSLNPTFISKQVESLNIEDNDEANISISGDVVIDEGNAGQKTATFTVTVDKQTSSGFKIAYATADLSAKTSDNDYVASLGELEFGASELSKTITVSINGDTKIESDELFELKLGAIVSPFNQRFKITDASSTVTIKNNDIGNLTITKIDGEEGLKDASFSIALESGLTADVPLRVDYTLNGDAESNIDYNGSSNYIDIPAGQNSVTVNLSVVDDAIIEDTEKIELEASVRTNTYSIGIPSSVTTINIADNDQGTLSISPASISESNAGTQTLDFNVTLSHATSKDFTVEFSTIDGSASDGSGDYTAQSSILSFQRLVPGQTRVIKVVVKDDKVVEATEELTAKLNSISNSFNHRLTLGNNTALGTITDDDFGLIKVTKEDGDENGTVPAKFIFSFMDNVTSDRPTSITYNLAGIAGGGGLDYTTATSGTLIIPARQASVSLNLPVIDDDKIEGNEDVKLLNPICTSPYVAITLDNVFPDINIADNDNGTLILSSDVVLSEGNNGTQNAIYTLTLNKATNSGFDVAYQTKDGTALIADDDYLPASGSLSFAGTAGESKTISITIKGDQKIEANEIFNLELKDPTRNFGGLLTLTDKIRQTKIENDDSGTITIAKVDGVEGGQAGSFIFSYPTGVISDIPVTVNYSLNGTAKGNGEDHNGVSPASVIIPAGQNSVTVSYTVVDDAVIEGTENIDLEASVQTNAYSISTPAGITSLSIADNDQGTLSISPATISESNAGTQKLNFNVKLSKATAHPFTVTFSTADGSATNLSGDYTSLTDALSFAGTAGEVQTIRVVVNDDKVVEATEELTAKLSSISNTFNSRLAFDVASAVGTITDNDLGTLQVTKVDGSEAGSIPAKFIFTFKDNVTSDKVTSIAYNLAGTAGGSGQDYNETTSGTISIPAGNNSVTLDLSVIDDDKVEGNEVVKILNANSSSPYAAVTLENIYPDVNIADNDNGSLILSSDVVISEGNNGTQNATYTVTLNKATNAGFEVAYQTKDGTALVADEDYLPSTGSLSFAGTAGESKSINIVIKGDQKIEANELFSLELKDPTLNFGGLLTFTDKIRQTKIENDDVASITVSKVNGAESGSQSGSFTFSYPVGVVADIPVSINYTLSGSAKGNSEDYEGVSSATATIPAGESSYTVTLPVKDDAIIEDTENIDLEASVQTNAYSISTPAGVTSLSITDNDQGTLSISPAVISESNAGTQTLDFKVTLSHATSKQFTVAYSTADGSANNTSGDYTAMDNVLSFDGLVAGQTRTIKVVVNDDKVVEATEDLTAKLSSISNTFNNRLTFDVASALGTITDNDFGIIQVTKLDGSEAGSVPAKFIFTFKDNVTSDRATSIAYNLAGTAGGSGQDYNETTSGTISIPAGSNSVTLDLSVIDDDKVEGNEVVKILNANSSSPYAAVTLENIYPDVNIADNDNGTLSLSSDVVMSEGANGTQNATYTLTLNKATNSGFEVTYKTKDGTALVADEDYLPVNSSLSFAGTAGESKTINIVIKGDQKIEANELFSLELNDPTLNFGGLLAFTDKIRQTKIENDDAASITVSKVNGAESGSQAGSFTFSYPVGVVADIPVSINYTLSGTAKGNNEDYDGVSSNSAVIPAGQNSVTVNYPVIDDAIIEDTEEIELSATVQTNAYSISTPAGITSLSIADNDQGTLSISPATISESNAGTKTLDFKVTLNKPTAKPFTVTFSTADGSASNLTGDYTLLNETLSFSGAFAGEVQTIKVPVKDDKIVEATEDLTATLNSISNTFNSRLAFDNNSAIGTITDDDFGIIQVTKVDGDETGSLPAKFIFSFKNNVTSDRATSIAYNLTGTAGGSGQDYNEATSGTISIKAGESSVTLSLPVIDDDKVEGSEDVKLVNLSSASPYTAISLDNVYPDLTIADNDNGALVLSSNVVLSEGNNGTQNAIYTLTLSKATNSGFEVAYQTKDGTATVADDDYLPAAGSLSFTGIAGESKTITIAVKGDQKIEANELFNLELNNPSSNFGGLLSFTDKARQTKIENDDSGKITISKANGLEGGQAGAFTFSYPANVIADIPVQIDYSLSGTAKGNSEDYVGVSPSSIIIPAGQNSYTLPLAVMDDALVEDTETIVIAATAASNAYTIGMANTTESLDIIDNDVAKLSINPVSITEGDAGVTNLDFKVTLDKGTGKPFTLAYEVADGTARVADGDYNPVAAIASIAFAGLAGEPQTISVQVKGDKKIEADEVLTVLLRGLSDNFNGRLTLANGSASGTILNNDLGTITITKTDGAEAGSVAGSFIFSLPTGITSDQPISLNYSLNGTAGGNGVDFNGATSGSITIPTGDNSAVLPVPVINDVIVEDDETVAIGISSMVPSGNAAITLNNTLPVMKIMDDDFGNLTIGEPITKAEGNSGTTAFEFPVTLSKATGLPFNLKYTTANGTASVGDDDFIGATDQVLNFAGLAGEVQLVNIQVKGDLKLEADELFNVAIHSLSQNFANRLHISSASSAGTIKNDDTGGITVTKTDGTEGSQDAAFIFSFPQNVTSEAATIINYSLKGTATGADYTTSGISSVTIPPGTNSVTLPIKVVDDTELEDMESVILTINSISNLNSVLAWELPIPVVNIYDNDKADISIVGPAPVIEKHNGKTTVTFTVKLDNLTSKSFDVDYTTTNGSASADDNDFDSKIGHLTFSGFAGETKQVTVDIIGDLNVESDETFNLLLSNITPAFGGRLTAQTPQASAKIMNDDFAPVANPDMSSTNEDTPVTFSVIANDTDADGINASTLTIQNQPIKGQLKVNTNGTVTYTPVTNDFGTYTFTYTVKDNLGLVSNLATATISVLPVNDPPSAGDDIFFISKGASFRGTVAANDSDIDEDVIKFRVLTYPSKATLSEFNTFGGTFRYTPQAGFVGKDEFTYEVYDPDGLKDTAKVVMNVQGNVTVSLTPQTATIREGDTVIVHAQINDVLLQDVQVTLQYGGNASSGKDYIIEPQTSILIIPSGSKVSDQKLSVQSLKDYLKEGTEQLSIRITSVNPTGFVSIGNSTDITINDFYPEGKPVGPGENDDIVPDPLLSPNNDGIGNEKFVIRNIERYPDNEVLIFNRWGNEVYRIKGYNNEDKAFTGVSNSGLVSNSKAPLPDGVYYYIIRTKMADGDKNNKGYVILKR